MHIYLDISKSFKPKTKCKFKRKMNYLLLLRHCLEVQFLLSVLLPLVLVCTQVLEHCDQADQSGLGHGKMLHLLSWV